ncbi:hypothetical protein BJ508DRAFT_325127 [Ascobolus immersus RN42]|uniref:Uncharacterized protein n=1 Tax=Ascobolus immersus RN42 TaxID=1160509 RepID=A0A3N4IA73_ASCIM|nr:hypothetical protein BJ508DRAFT_325127 [Ascobolus immersus RN42]
MPRIPEHTTSKKETQTLKHPPESSIRKRNRQQDTPDSSPSPEHPRYGQKTLPRAPLLPKPIPAASRQKKSIPAPTERWRERYGPIIKRNSRSKPSCFTWKDDSDWRPLRPSDPYVAFLKDASTATGNTYHLKCNYCKKPLFPTEATSKAASGSTKHRYGRECQSCLIWLCSTCWIKEARQPSTDTERSIWGTHATYLDFHGLEQSHRRLDHMTRTFRKRVEEMEKEREKMSEGKGKGWEEVKRECERWRGKAGVLGRENERLKGRIRGAVGELCGEDGEEE